MPHSPNNLFSLLFENLRDHAIFMTDAEGLVSTWAPGVASVFGYEEKEFVWQPIETLFTPSDREAKVPEATMRLASQDGSVQSARWQLRKNGSLFWAHHQIIPLRDGQGAVDGYAHIFRDDSQNRKIKKELGEAQERLQTALNVARIGTWMWDIQNDRVIADTNLSRFFGVSSEDAQGGPVSRYMAAIHPEDAPQVATAINESVVSGEAFNADYRLVEHNGSIRWVEARGKIAFDTQGQPLQLNGTIFDITERKLAEVAMRQSEERYRTLFEAIDSGFCVIEMVYNANGKAIDYRFIEINPAFEKQTGLTDAIGKTMRSMAPDLDDSWFEIYGKVASSGEPTRFENRADALHRWFDLYAFRIGPAEHNRVAVLFTDITERKEGENALLKAHLKSEETSRLKDEFLATLSHELRSPLNAILGWSNILRSNSLDIETQKRGLETIERNARAQAQLVEDLLDVSRILTGKLRLDMQPVILATVLDSAVKSVLPAAQAKQVQLMLSVDHPSAMVLGDATRLEQIFSNLLNNAIKFSLDGGNIEATLTVVDSKIQVQVSDTGKGITAEFLPHVFERFRQADASSTRTNGGLGIGLGLVHSLVEEHRGAVEAQSQGEGRGSTFLVSLPLLVPHSKTVSSTVEASTPEPEEVKNALPLAGLRILLVDDEFDAREVTGIVLQRNGALVQIADCAAVSFEQMTASRTNKTPFDVLVSDIGMPNEDGFELMRRIRELEKRDGGFLPAIALTAYASEKDIAIAMDAGFQMHLSKPVDMSDLVGAVRRLESLKRTET